MWTNPLKPFRASFQWLFTNFKLKFFDVYLWVWSDCVWVSFYVYILFRDRVVLSQPQFVDTARTRWTVTALTHCHRHSFAKLTPSHTIKNTHTHRDTSLPCSCLRISGICSFLAVIWNCWTQAQKLAVYLLPCFGHLDVNVSVLCLRLE